MNSSPSFLILGGGLAGTFLAARLCQAGQQVCLIDDRQPRSASRVAAGMFNVITGRFGAKSWLADELLQEIQDFFAQEEFQSLQSFLHYQEIYRPFRQEGEYNKWLGRSVDPNFAHLVKLEEYPLLPEQIINPLGGIRILPCGWAEVGGLIDALQQLLVEKFSLEIVAESLPYAAIDRARQQVHTQVGLRTYDHLILATGPQLAACPWLPAGSIIPNKGEILFVEAPDLALPFLLSKKVYLLPQVDGTYLCGSTYANQFEHERPTEAGKAEILLHLQNAIHVPVKVVDHWAGLRPTTRNRRPLVGSLPDDPRVHILGGFGTKGMLLAPYTSRLLAEKLLGGKDNIPVEAQLSRLFG
jgi:glycine/D-amino acid oxidase-like deaminating enzyme